MLRATVDEMPVARLVSPWLGLSITMMAGGCRPPEEARRYQLHRQILTVRPATKEVLIKHGDIRNFMPGMTTVLVRRRRIRHVIPGLQRPDKRGRWNCCRLIERRRAGFFECGQPGRPSRASAPEYCPLIDRRFRDLQRAIQSDWQHRGRVRLLSVSFDPDQDTPDLLAAHAKKAGADPAIWSFAAAPREVLDRFAATFGIDVIREADGTITHNLRTAVIDPQGRVVRVHDGNQWTSAQVLDDLERSDTR